LIAVTKTAPDDLRRYIGERFARLIAKPRFIEAIPGHLGYDGAGRLKPVTVTVQYLRNGYKSIHRPGRVVVTERCRHDDHGNFTVALAKAEHFV
jgi:hypothetical protein